jgi:hypothetical protein
MRLRLRAEAEHARGGDEYPTISGCGEFVLVLIRRKLLTFREEIAPGFPPTLNPTVSHPRELP